MRPVANPDTILAVKSAREVWWKDFVYLRNGDQAGSSVLHLVNPPPYPLFGYRQEQLPTPLEAISVQATIPADCTFTRALLLNPDAPEPLTRAPALDAKTAGGQVTVVVPKVELWSVVVFEWQPKDATSAFARLTPPAEASPRRAQRRRQAVLDRQHAGES